MARIVKVDGDYKVSVTAGNTITLDTGPVLGKTIVTGDLEVKGQTQTISAVNTTIADNIITLNKGETGPGISASNNYQAGIEIDRGSLSDASEGYIKTSGIVAGGTLYVQTGNGVISVTNSNSYEEQVFTYSGGSISDGGSGVIIDDDIIPNTKAVTDYVAYYLANESAPSIVQNDSEVRVNDFQTSGNPSEINFKIDNNSVATIFSNRTEFGDIRLSGSIISTTSSNQNLTLEAQGTGAVQVNDVLEITPTPGVDDPLTDPSAPSSGVKIYSKSASTGDTGIYYRNSSKQDEIISRNRALVLSMIF